MKYLMPLCLSLLMLGMGCASVQVEDPLESLREKYLLPADLYITDGEKKRYYKCLYNPFTETIKCAKDNDPNPPRCL